MRKRIGICLRLALVCVVLLGQPVDSTNASQREDPVDWDLLSNGLIEVQYDETGDGVPDHAAVHQVIWSGWTTQPLSEIEAQAAADGQWMFIVEYDQDRFVYLTNATPLLWTHDPARHENQPALPVELEGMP